ncbi:snRNA-activating protein complex subunit isoform X3 [Carya illinoinensis]|uniref:snRNA-activating protein complex subunit isoform X3 n=1 Tax=Carya illinoinensis TaxID=32201 RepID=UPI001C727C6B|nr:snRNA-activating protein complex subunit isoform X3 [Carya illinoinensis]
MGTMERGASPGGEVVEEDDGILSIPRGGPIYAPNLVSPLSSVPHFEASLLLQLQNLEAELGGSDSSQPCDEDISVDELKILSEEELVDMAMKVAFQQGEENHENSSQPSEEQSAAAGKKDAHSRSRNKHACSESFSGEEKLLSSFEIQSDSPSLTGCIQNSHSRKRKRSKVNNHAIEDSYTAKVEQLVKIKQKQDEDKAAARLHSFNGGCKINESAIILSERTERMKSLRFTSYAMKVKSPSIGEHSAVPYPEVVLCVEVYHSSRKWVKVMLKAGQHDPSGYFLVEDVFFNDLRDPSAIDYSEPIFDWLRNSKDEALKKWESITTGELQQKQKAIVGDVTGLQLPQFKAVDMHTTRFCDIRFRLGAGYLYCHQGDCKHSIVIRDMRLIHPEDVHNRGGYPIVLFQIKSRVQKCDVCKIYRATKVTVDDKWAQKNPCYFCKDCYFLLHYGKDESLLYNDFSVYDYQHD